MRTQKLTAVFVLLAFCYSGRVTASPNAEAITADDLFKVAGILYWNVEIPPDLQENETLIARWNFPSAGGEKREAKPMQMNFQGIPPATLVKVFLWAGGTDGDIPDSSGMKFCLRYKTRFAKTKTVFGKVKVPPGFTRLSSHEPSGTLLGGSGDSLISLYNEKMKRECDLLLSLETKIAVK